MERIFHIVPATEWEKALAKGFYEAPSLHSEGFIHCSEIHQVPGVLSRYYQGKQDLLQLTIDPSRLNSPLKLEWSPSVKENFPHIYGVLNTDAVIATDKI